MLFCYLHSTGNRSILEQSSNFVILKFYRKVYFSDTEACQGLHMFPKYDDEIFNEAGLVISVKIQGRNTKLENDGKPVGNASV